MKIIAEIGVNFDSLEQAFEMIEMSKWAGCSCAKFQLYDSETVKDHPLRSELEKRMLSRDDAQELVDFGRSIGQIVFFTPMFLDAIDWIAEIGAPMIKIRFKDRYNFPLINKSMEVVVPVLISADHHYTEYHSAKLLYCVPKYPASEQDYPSILAPRFAGFSDHTKGMEIMRRGLQSGAEFCECHVMLDGLRQPPIEEAWSKTFEEVRTFLQPK